MCVGPLWALLSPIHCVLSGDPKPVVSRGLCFGGTADLGEGARREMGGKVSEPLPGASQLPQTFKPHRVLQSQVGPPMPLNLCFGGCGAA